MIQQIYIIDNDLKLINLFNELFKNEKEYSFQRVKTEEIDIALRDIPSLIIINEDNIDEEIIKLCTKIRENEDNSITPIIVISSNKEKEHKVEILKTDVEYYIKKPIDPDFLYYTVYNMVKLMYRNRRVSPLTGLPGNVQIQAEIKKRLLKKESFAIFYFDLDNFKAYNDVYRFVKGDEIIKFTAKTISKIIHNINCENTFIGHIGGDDFIAIVSNADYEKICQDIILEFDTNITKYFTETDINRGYIEVANRKGIIEDFPLITISIGVVEVDKDRFKNTLEIGEIGAGVKHLAKTTLGSTYVINRRKK